MTYTIGEDYLRLSCKVDNLEFKVLFSDPRNNEQAFCLLSYPTVLCHHHYSNSSINQNLSTNETVLTIRGTINANVNGEWLCRHGNRFERATVDVKFDAISDVKGLDITANQTLPFDEGAIVEVTCAAQITGRFAELTWDCANVTSAKNRILNCSTAQSKILYKASKVNNGSFCKCIAKIGRFVTSTSIKLNIREKFELQLIDHVRCNASASVSIFCDINRHQSESGFAPWIHSYNGIFIRYLKGTQNDTCSIISIDACSWEDTGQYSCRAWVKDFNQILWKNETTSLIINGPPYIVKASYKLESSLTVDVRFICFPPPEILQWYTPDMPIQNQTNFHAAKSKKVLSLYFYGMNVGVDGYVATYTIQHLDRKNSYENVHVVIQNMFGNATYYYSIQKEGIFFSRQILQWCLIVLAVFVISVVGTALLNKKRCSNNERDEPLDRAIYYAAPGSNDQPNVYNDIQIAVVEESLDHEYLEIENEQIETDKD
ncbi:unnamed protein product [Mytilus coruscus]|uniref:Ig-like domain-containing protein n=1 Tax=Mytilus coruscus TaxID=42192 RepID=A0A6J7ZZN5_MYTCO|nr:unnamed protein product [Mytilus coruscus]